MRHVIKLIHLQLVREISSTPRPQSRTARITRFTRVAHVSLVPHVSLVALVSERQVQGIRDLLRFICAQLLLRCQVSLVLNEELVDTTRDMLVDLAHPTLHVVGRFLVCHIEDSNDGVVCVPVSVEHVPRDLELKRVVRRCRNLVDVVAGCHRVHDV